MIMDDMRADLRKGGTLHCVQSVTLDENMQPCDVYVKFGFLHLSYLHVASSQHPGQLSLKPIVLSCASNQEE